jgi:hypothetical protein
VNIADDIALVNVARRARLAVLEGVLAIEALISEIISHYFFEDSKERKAEFEALILASDTCTAAAKRRLVSHIIDSRELLIGAAKSEFDDLIRKAFAWRNAFAHGELTSEGRSVWLSYFEGKPRRQELTDAFLTDVENLLQKAYNQSLQLTGRIGATKLMEASQPPLSPPEG